MFFIEATILVITVINNKYIFDNTQIDINEIATFDWKLSYAVLKYVLLSIRSEIPVDMLHILSKRMEKSINKLSLPGNDAVLKSVYF